MNSFLNRRDFLEQWSVGYSKTFQPVNMSRFAKMLFKGLATCVDHVAAYLTRVFLAETVEFVKPEGDGFAVPSEGEFKRVVDVIVALAVFLLFVSGFSGWVQGFVLGLLEFFLHKIVSESVLKGKGERRGRRT